MAHGGFQLHRTASQGTSSTSKTDYSDQNNAHFVNLYRELVEHFDSAKCPCIGVIERSATRTPQVVTAHLQSLVPKAQLNDLIDKFELYHLTDTMLLSLILAERMGTSQNKRSAPRQQMARSMAIRNPKVSFCTNILR